jgi:hypothetical protein
MTPLRRCLGLLGLCALAVVSSGCNIPALAYFLISPDEKVAPSLQQLATDEKDTKVKVAVIVSSGPGVYDEGTRVDRELAQAVIKRLTELCKQNKENVSVIQFHTIERCKSVNPEVWSPSLELVAIGQKLHAHYVVHVEIEALSLYKPGSSNTLYQGQTDIKVQLVNVRKPDSDTVDDLMHEMYPESERDVFETPNPMLFRKEFLDRVATKICWRFTKHAPEDNYPAR